MAVSYDEKCTKIKLTRIDLGTQVLGIVAYSEIAGIRIIPERLHKGLTLKTLPQNLPFASNSQSCD